jgi:calcium-dependent protein kinase
MEIATLTYIASNMLPKSMQADSAKLFKAFDIGGDGRLSKEDVSDGFLDYYGKVVDMADIEKMFEVIDADQSGFIDYTEFMVATLDNALLT